MCIAVLSLVHSCHGWMGEAAVKTHYNTCLRPVAMATQKVEWWNISDLPRKDDPGSNQFYMVLPFVKYVRCHGARNKFGSLEQSRRCPRRHLKHWLGQQRRGCVPTPLLHRLAV